MSVALEFAPSIPVAAPRPRLYDAAHGRYDEADGGAQVLTAVPLTAVPPLRVDRPSSLVAVLRAPSAGSLAAPLRLTRRGVVVLTLVLAAFAMGLVWVAAASAPAPIAAPPAGPAVVTVSAGDTLWSIASSVAPQRDPRAEVAILQQLNGLRSVNLQPGQLLRVR